MITGDIDRGYGRTISLLANAESGYTTPLT